MRHAHHRRTALLLRVRRDRTGIDWHFSIFGSLQFCVVSPVAAWVARVFNVFIFTIAQSLQRHFHRLGRARFLTVAALCLQRFFSVCPPPLEYPREGG